MHMNGLPEEIILQVFSYLDINELVDLQSVCQSFKRLARDDGLWKANCFWFSRAENTRRRLQQLEAQESALSELRRAMSSFVYDETEEDLIISEANSTSRNQALLGMGSSSTIKDPEAKQRLVVRAFASWDPIYPGEQHDFYQDFIHRHGTLSLDWLEPARDHRGLSHITREAQGMGLLRDKNTQCADKVLAPLDDGSISLWDVSAHSNQSKQGRIKVRTASKYLTDGRSIKQASSRFVDVGVVENVQVDSCQQVAYIGLQDQLFEFDLHEFKIRRQKKFPSFISCISAAKFPHPLTIGTSQTLHLYDSRVNEFTSKSSEVSVKCEQIGGLRKGGDRQMRPTTPRSNVVLAEPSPLSILHAFDTAPHERWVAGRFKSILCYDLRCWPRLHRSMFSGARISSLASLPYPYRPRNHNHIHGTTVPIRYSQYEKKLLGTTLIAAGEYKGKGSLELYDIPNDRNTTASNGFRFSQDLRLEQQRYTNRQTASSTRLLSVALHGTRIVVSDGDGKLKWFERDGSSFIRALNVNDYYSLPTLHGPNKQKHPLATMNQTPAILSYEDEQTRVEQIGGSRSGVFADNDNEPKHIIQRIIALRDVSDLRNSSSISDIAEFNRDDILLWTSEGAIGRVGFGGRLSSTEIENSDDASHHEQTEEDLMSQQYDAYMRRALERQADEARFMRSMGLNT